MGDPIRRLENQASPVTILVQRCDLAFSTACGSCCGAPQQEDDPQLADAQDLWMSCQASLQTQVSDAVWRSTFQDIAAIATKGDVLHLAVPNAMVKDRVENRYLSLVEDIVRDVGGNSLTIDLAVRPDAADITTIADPLADRLGAAPKPVADHPPRPAPCWT